MNLRKIATMMAGVMVGNWIAERFVLQAGPDDPTGFIPVADGIGMDEVARAALAVGAATTIDKLTRRVF